MSKRKSVERGAPATDDWNLPEHSASVLLDSGGIMNLREHAWNEAMDERPHMDATKPNSAEELVINHFMGQHSRLREAAKARYQTMHERFNKASKPPDTAGLISSIGAARTCVLKDIAMHRIALDEARRAKERAEQSRVEFKQANNLRREARYPESKLLHFAIILMIVLIECVANMYYFAQGNELGLLGGIFQAALISVANVGSAIVIGFVARAATHVSRAIKWPAIAGLAIYAFGICAFNLLAGHYRDLMTSPDAALENAIPSMLADPFGLSFHSVLLFVTGLIAAVLAIYKGMTVDDAYLGYGDVDRDCRATAEDYVEIYGRVQAQVVAHMDNLRSESKALRELVATQRETMEKCIDDLGSLSEVYSDRVRGIAGECRLQLKAYRQYNAEIRVSPVPAYFETCYPEFNDAGQGLALPPVSEWEQTMARVEPAMKDVEKFTLEEDAKHEALVGWAIHEFERAAAGETWTPADQVPAPGLPPEAGTLKLLKMNEEG
jgi:hypothetical protein